jgi:hypothetical protein
MADDRCLSPKSRGEGKLTKRRPFTGKADFFRENHWRKSEFVLSLPGRHIEALSDGVAGGGEPKKPSWNRHNPLKSPDSDE